MKTFIKVAKYNRIRYGKHVSKWLLREAVIFDLSVIVRLPAMGLSNVR